MARFGAILKYKNPGFAGVFLFLLAIRLKNEVDWFHSLGEPIAGVSVEGFNSVLSLES